MSTFITPITTRWEFGRLVNPSEGSFTAHVHHSEEYGDSVGMILYGEQWENNTSLTAYFEFDVSDIDAMCASLQQAKREIERKLYSND